MRSVLLLILALVSLGQPSGVHAQEPKRLWGVKVKSGASVEALAFSPDGKTLASGHRDQTVTLWDLTGKEIFTIAVKNDQLLRSLTFSPDGKTIAVVHAQFWPEVTLLDVEKKQVGELFRKSALAFPPGRNPLVAAQSFATGGDAVEIRDVIENKALTTFAVSMANNTQWALAGDGKSLAVWRLGVAVFDPASGKKRFDVRCGSLNTVKFSPNGKTMATVGYGPPGELGIESGEIKLHDAVSGKELAHLKHPDGGIAYYSPHSVTFTADGAVFVYPYREMFKTKLRFWDVAGGKEVASLDARPLLEAKEQTSGPIAISPDGTKVATGAGAEVQLWDIAKVLPPRKDADKKTAP